MARLVNSPMFRIFRLSALSFCLLLLLSCLLAHPQSGSETPTQLTIRGIENRTRIESIEAKIKKLEDVDLAAKLAGIEEKLRWIEQMAVGLGLCIAGLVMERLKVVLWPRSRRREEEFDE